MQHAVQNRATFEVAGSMDISGRATADEIHRALQTSKERSFWRIVGLPVLGSIVVGLFVALAPMPAQAEDDKDIRAEIAALQAQVAALQDEVSALQKANTGQQNEINNLQASNTTLQNQLANAKNVLALDPFVSVDSNPEIGVAGPHITFTGANIHIVSGSGRTDDNIFNGGSLTGRGNLIIGYDEEPTPPMDSSGLPPLGPGERGGSHNLVIGGRHKFTHFAYGGLVAGDFNEISAGGASVTGGAQNYASGSDSSVTGGLKNIASGFFASVTGGDGNIASGTWASVTGGTLNTAGGEFAIVSGGQANTASGRGSGVLGGENNTASEFLTVVLGGTNVTDNKANSIAPQPPFP